MKGDFTRETFQPTNHYSSVRSQQGRVQVDADWNEAIDILAHWDRTTRRDVIGLCGGPQGQDSDGNDHAGFRIDIVDGELLIRRGRYYVDGLLVENEADVTITAQPDLPNLADTTLEDVLSQSEEGLVPGIYLAYLDVWEHHITALEAPAIRELALGGPDTTTRTKVVWQVRLMQAGLEEGEDAPLHCASELPLWDKVTDPSSGRLSARAEPGEAGTSPCEVPTQAGYRGLENQLYRVEVHRVRSANDITIKWSRENGSLVFGWIGQDPLNANKLTLSSTGRDGVLGLATDDWVELTDDKHELRGDPGLLVEVVNVVGNVLTIDPGSETVDISAFPVNPKVRRWDMPRLAGEISVDLTLADNWIALERGVEVKLEPGTYRTGDYWLIPARTLTGDIEWPHDTSNPPQPLPQLPHGIQHHYCRLALLEFDAVSWDLISDCRTLFPPTTQLRSLFYVGGDAQEVMPDPTKPAALLPLPWPLQVGVANGTQRVLDATVRFTVLAGSGRLQGNLTTVEIATVGGIASCDWSLDSTTPSQQVEASLLDAGGMPVHVPIRFTANLSLASGVAYDPRQCADLSQAGVRTVQLAIDELCRLMQKEEPGIHILSILSAFDDKPLENDVIVPLPRLAAGLFIDCDAPLSQVSGGGVPSEPKSSYSPGTVPAKPTCVVTLDLPYPLGPERDLWQFGGIAGFQPLILASTVVIQDKRIEWRPTNAARMWLEQRLFQRLNSMEVTDRILAHLTIKGNFIWHGESTGEPSIYVDGQAFGRPRPPDRVDLRLPSGDGRRGGDFDMWFWLMPSEAPPKSLSIQVAVSRNTLTGTVFDATGQAVGGATIILTGPGGPRTMVTTADGKFQFAGLAPGTYTVVAQLGDLTGQTQATISGTSVPPGTPTAIPGLVPGPTLADVSGIGPVFRARLEANGVTLAAEVASMEAPHLAEMLRTSEARANTIINSARRLLMG